MQNPSPFLVWSFSGVVAAVALTLVVSVYLVELRAGTNARAAAFRSGLTLGIAGAFLALTWLLASRGLLNFESRPPGAPLLILAVTAGTVLLALSPVGRRAAAIAPLGLLVAIQSFRLPLELVMHRAASEGVMPVQMSYSGMNFDIVTGFTAIAVAAALPFAGGRRHQLVAAWNVLGSLLLVTIMTIAWLSAPTPLRVFHNEPANVWITQAPFVWLPVFLVQVALFGHLITFRALAHHSRERDADPLSLSPAA